MNKPQVIALATIAIAFAGAASSALAIEGEQYVAPTGTLTRAEVQAELQRSRGVQVNAVQLGEATQFVDAPSRAAYANAAPATNATRVIQLGEATQFVDAPGTRTRDEVRAEARAAASAARSSKQSGS